MIEPSSTGLLRIKFYTKNEYNYVILHYILYNYLYKLLSISITSQYQAFLFRPSIYSHVYDIIQWKYINH